MMRRLWRHTPPADRLMLVMLALMLLAASGNIVALLYGCGHTA